MATKILIAGYHGFGNCGDEAILLAMKNNIKELYKDVELTVLSFSPADTETIYGINSVNRFKPIKVIKAILGSNILISGGGSLLQDETSTRSLMYYLAIILAAKLFGKKVMLYSNGIGPVSKAISKLLIRLVVNRVDIITLREESSRQELTNLGVKKPPIFVTADPAFTLKGISRHECLEMLNKQNIPCDKEFLGVSIRPWKQLDFTDKIAEICDYAAEKYNMTVLFITMQEKVDIKVSQNVKNKMKNPSYILNGKSSSNEVLGVVGIMGVIISMRLHTLIFAGVQNVPMLGLVYDPKVSSYLEMLDMPDCGNIQDLDVSLAKERLDMLISGREAYRAQLKIKTDVLKEKALQNDLLLKKLL